MKKKEGVPITPEEIKLEASRKERKALEKERAINLGGTIESDEAIKVQKERERLAKEKIKELNAKNKGKKKSDGTTTADTATPETVDTASEPGPTQDSDSEPTTTETEETKEIKSAGEEVIAKLEQKVEEARAALEGLMPESSHEKERYERDLQYISEKLEIAKEIFADRKEKEFLYYVTEKSASRFLLEPKTNFETILIDLRQVEKDGIERNYTDIRMIDKNEGCFNFNHFGFAMVLKNVEELRTDKGISAHSDDAVYKIIGPSDEIIADDIKGYEAALNIYIQSSKTYEEKIKEEFKNLNPEDQKILGLDHLKDDIEFRLGSIIENCEAQKEAHEKLATFEKVTAVMEADRALELEKQPLQFKKRVIGGLTKWENYGEGEDGIEGNKHRMIKAGVNMALIGAASMFSMHKLMEYGVVSATAVGGSIASRLGMRLGIGMGIGGAVDVGNKYINSEKMKKLMPWIMGGASVIMATALSGAVAAGVVAGGSAYLGYQVSKRIKGIFTDKSIEEKRDRAKEKLFNKYKVEDGTLDLTQVAEFEKDYRKLLIKFENKTITYKLLKEGAKLLAGTAVSVGAMSVSGFAKEAFGNTETANHSHALPSEENKVEQNQHHPSPEQQHAEVVKNLEHMKADHEAAVKHLNELQAQHENTTNEQQNQPESNHNIETNPINVDHKSLSVEFSAKGGIQTILDMKAVIHAEYPDLIKAPAELQEFMNTNSTEEAIKLGFYDPNNPNGAESMTVGHGSTLTFDEKGLSMHDVKTGENHTLIETKGTAETIEKYHGKMFDSDHSASKIENTHHYNPNEAPQQVDAETGQPMGTEHQVDAVTGQSIIDTSHYDPNNPNFDHQYDAPQQIDAETGKPIDTLQYGPNNHADSNLGGHGSQQTNIPAEHFNPERDLSVSDLKHVNETYSDHIKNLFPNDKAMNEWSQLKYHHTPADDLIKQNHIERGLKPELQPLAHYIEKLEEVTGLHPEGASIINPDPETVPHYMLRAMEYAKFIGKLDDVKL